MSSSLEFTMKQAIDLHRRGDGDAAEPLYRVVLAEQPSHAEANHKLGMLLAQKGSDAESLPLFQAALKSQPGVGQYWLSYASALLATGHPREAQMVLARGQERGLAGPELDALRRRAHAPLSPTDVQFEQGTAHALQGQVHDAISVFRKLVSAAPDHAEAHFRLGSLLSETGQIADGFAHFMKRATLVRGGKSWQQDRPGPAHRTKHDREQAEYLAERLGTDVSAAMPFQLEDGARLPGPAVSPANATAELAQRWQTSHPQMVVIDSFLTPPALEKLREYCAGSTIWHRNYDAGYIGATPEDGLACPLMVQIAEEIRATFPLMIGKHNFRYLGAFKYDSALSTGTNTHADNSAVNVNLYIAPDEANLDPESGGMDIWDVRAPAGEEMRRYNGDEALAREFLERSGARMTRVPHRANRAIIFKSDLFHKTSACRFREGYLNKRINISLLFGERSGS
ncbi:MAG: tetratricopeptide repeat protein [Rhizomicrobium sp.]